VALPLDYVDSENLRRATRDPASEFDVYETPLGKVAISRRPIESIFRDCIVVTYTTDMPAWIRDRIEDWLDDMVYDLRDIFEKHIQEKLGAKYVIDCEDGETILYENEDIIMLELETEGRYGNIKRYMVLLDKCEKKAIHVSETNNYEKYCLALLDLYEKGILTERDFEEMEIDYYDFCLNYEHIRNSPLGKIIEKYLSE